MGTGLRITCSKDELVQALGVVSRAVSTRTSVQILSGILLEPQRLRAAARGDRHGAFAARDAQAQIEGDGAIVLPGKTFADIARLLPADEVSIEHKPAESVVHVTSGTASYTLNTYNPEDFPRLPELDAVTTFAVEREPLLETIGRVARAASRDESRPVLTGILVQFTGGKLVMAATDSYRLAVKETTLEGTVPELEAIVPGRALQELARIASAGDEVEVGVHENQVHLRDRRACGSRRAASTASSRTTSSCCPEAFEYELTVPRLELLDVVKRASVMIQRSTPLQIRFAEGELTVIARTHEVGESKESMPIAFTGDTLEMGFNADFLRDGLESLEGDDVRVKLISPLRPAVIQGEGDDFTYLVMPIRLPG